MPCPINGPAGNILLTGENIPRLDTVLTGEFKDNHATYKSILEDATKKANIAAWMKTNKQIQGPKKFATPQGKTLEAFFC